MQLPSTRTPIARCEQLALYTQRMLQKFPSEAGLAGLDAALAASTQALMTSQAAYRDAITSLIAVRVDVKFADYVADKGVRQGQRFAQLADGGPNGRFASHVYPNGVSPIVRLVGDSQIAEMKNVEGRYESLAGTWADAASEGAKLTALRTQYETALAGRKDAMQNSANRRAARDVAKEDFLDFFAKVSARVREVFPRDRVMQDLFFDSVATSSPTSVGDDIEEDEGAPVEPSPVSP